jgi:hypothetical protein
MSTIPGAHSSHHCMGGADHEASGGRFSGVIDRATGEITPRLGIPQNV